MYVRRDISLALCLPSSTKRQILSAAYNRVLQTIIRGRRVWIFDKLRREKYLRVSTLGFPRPRLSSSRRSTLAAKRRRFRVRFALIINLHRSSRKPAAGKRATASEEDSFSRVITGGGLIRRHRGAVQAREARPCNERKTRGKKSREPFVLNDSQSPAESLGKFADSSAN